MTDTPEKRPVGRPSKYKPEYCEQMIEFFDTAHETMVVDKIEEEGLVIGDDQTPATKVKTTSKRVGADLPTFVSFGRKIGVSHATLLRWKQEFPEFCEAYESCRELQENVWKLNALKGNYNANFATFIGKNVFGYKDKTEVEQTVTVVEMPAIKLQSGEDLEFEVGEGVDG